MAFSPRLKEGVLFDEKTGDMLELRGALYNAAFPEMVVPKIDPDTLVTVRGVTESGPLKFSVPDTKLAVRLTFGNEIIKRSLAIDQIGIEPEERRVFIAYRHPFRYRLIPLQVRSCELEHFPDAA